VDAGRSGDRVVKVVDDRGRVFGRVNLVDAAVAVFLLALLPIAYGTWLLFHPRKVTISSVTRVTLTKEEQRIANPLRAAAKLKVKGTNFTPMLRAWIGSEPSFGFTFEDPGSADVIAPPMPPGEYDVALYDGGQEVARAPKAYVVPSEEKRDHIKAVGRLLDLDRATADGLQTGAVFPSPADVRVRIATLGPVVPGRYPLMVQPGADAQRQRLDVARDGTFERAASLILACDPGDAAANGCTFGSVFPSPNAQLQFAGAGRFVTFLVEEVLPPTDAQPLDVVVRFAGGPELSLVAAGDRDTLLDDRAAVVSSIGGRSAAGVDAHLRVGGDRAHDGWRYRNRPLKPGAPFVLTTGRYIATGVVVSLDDHAGTKEGKR